MTDTLPWLILALAGLSTFLLALLLFHITRPDRGTERVIREELRSGREEARSAGQEMRREVAAGLTTGSETITRTLETAGRNQQLQLENLAAQVRNLTASSREDLEKFRDLLDQRTREMQEGNEKRLEEMRRTVDEKLQGALEKRLGESFELVNKRLEEVYRGLGEMRSLAAGVGDLKRVLTNVKTRGTWAEIQLGTILEQVLTCDQYAKNVRVNPNSGAQVEYAVRLPGPGNEQSSPVWLPIDAKFPQEDYVRLQEAAERSDREAVRAATDNLARTVRSAAVEIKEKYLCPPHTTDFGIMFLATEGLYAEVLRQPGLLEEIQQKQRVIVAGPTTITAILNSLRLGFQTLSIEKQAAEVWRVLGAVKTEFGKFGEVLSRVKRQIDSASRSIESTEVRTRAMERRLRAVERLPDEEAETVLALDAEGPDPGEESESQPGDPGES